MNANVYYDQNEEVIVADFTNLTITRDIIDRAVADARELAWRLPRKVWAFACYRNSKMDQELVSSGYYDRKLAEFQDCVHGIIRYGSEESSLMLGLRTPTVAYHLQGSRSNFFATKEEALTALRRGEILFSQVCS
ncbi:MAG: hypothetical protein WCS37_18345 [Chloroflexota bacterium]|nr:hypothetical protein [Chloroflexota bacterium]